MVAVQEEAKYERTSGVQFGSIDIVRYAEAFGAVGVMIDSPDQISVALRTAFETPGPVVLRRRMGTRSPSSGLTPTNQACATAGESQIVSVITIW